MATHSSILAWEIPRTEEPGRLQVTELQKSSQGCNSATETVEARNVAGHPIMMVLPSPCKDLSCPKCQQG